ncbi:MAG: TrkA C-terminal domain-containing protein [Solirubrobacteraceae bacterium]
MQPVTQLDGRARLAQPGAPALDNAPDWHGITGYVTDTRAPKALSDETLERALRQLVLYGHAGLPVLDHDGKYVQGWLTRNDIFGALAEHLRDTSREIEQGAIATDINANDPARQIHTPPAPLSHYKLVEVTIGQDSTAVGRRVDQGPWPKNAIPLAIGHGEDLIAARGDARIERGSRLIFLAPAPDEPPP